MSFIAAAKEVFIIIIVRRSMSLQLNSRCLFCCRSQMMLPKGMERALNQRRWISNMVLPGSLVRLGVEDQGVSGSFPFHAIIV